MDTPDERLPVPIGAMCNAVLPLWKQPAPPSFPQSKCIRWVTNFTSFLWHITCGSDPHGQKPRLTMGGIYKKQTEKQDGEQCGDPTMHQGPHRARLGPLGAHLQPCLRKTPASREMRDSAHPWQSQEKVLARISQCITSVPSRPVWSCYMVWAGWKGEAPQLAR